MDVFESQLIHSLILQFEEECTRNKAGAEAQRETVAESALAMVLRSMGGVILLGHDLYRCEGARVFVHRGVPDLSSLAHPAMG